LTLMFPHDTCSPASLPRPLCVDVAVTVRLLFFFNDTATTEIYTLSLHDALPIEAHKIPASLLTLSDIGELGVKAVDDSGRVSFLPVSVLADEQGGTWVDGLPETVDLITVGQEFAVDGELVQARPENGGAS